MAGSYDRPAIDGGGGFSYSKTTVPGGGLLGTGVVEQSAGSGSSTSSGSGTSTTTGSSNTRGGKDYTQETQVNEQYMTDDSMAALDLLIQQLLGGGTQQMAQDRALRLQEIQANQALRGGYTKANAFADAQGAMAQVLQQAMEKSMPALVRAAEGAGTSQNSMRALLTQDALTRASQASASLGLDAASKYGGIAQGFSQVLEALTRPNNAVTDALLQALNTAKGAIKEGTTNVTGHENSWSNTDSSQTTNTSENKSTNTNQQGTQVTSRNPYSDVLYNQAGGATSLAGGSYPDNQGPGANDTIDYPGINATRVTADMLLGNDDWVMYSI